MGAASWSGALPGKSAPRSFASSDGCGFLRVALGFEIRVEFVLADGTEVWAQLTRNELQRLELREGQIAYLRPIQAKSFNGSPPSNHRGASTPHGSQDDGEAEKSAAV